MNLYTAEGRPYDPAGGEPKSDDQLKVAKSLQLWDYMNREYSQFFQRQLNVEKALADDPWTSDEKNHYRKQKRDMLHIPIMRVYEMQISGIQRSVRSDYRVDPTDQKTDPEIAEMAGKLLNGIAYDNSMAVADSQVFNNGMSGLGNYHVYESFENDPLGEMLVKSADPWSVLYDPEYREMDETDCRYLEVIRYMTAEQLRSKFQDKVRHLRFTKEEMDTWWGDMQEMIAKAFTIAGFIVDKQNGLYSVIELHERKESREYVIVHSEKGTVIANLGGRIPRSQINLIHAAMPFAYVRNITRKYIKITTVLPYTNVVLDERVEPFEDYSYSPYLSRRRGDTRIPKCSSYNYGMLGLQRETNLRHSNQQEYIVRSLRGGYWVFDRETLQEIDKHGHKIGKSYFISEKGKEPVAINPPNLSLGLQYLEEGSIRMFTLITGLDVQPMGKSEFAGESGYHAQIKREQSQTTIYPMLEDFDHCRAHVGKNMLTRALNMIKTPRFVRIVGKEGEIDFLYVADYMINNMKDVLRWDVRIEEGPFITTQKRERQESKILLFDKIVANYGPEVIAPGDFIRDSDLPNSEDLAEKADDRWIAKLSGPPTSEPSTIVH